MNRHGTFRGIRQRAYRPRKPLPMTAAARDAAPNMHGGDPDALINRTRARRMALDKKLYPRK